VSASDLEIYFHSIKYHLLLHCFNVDKRDFHIEFSPF